MWGSKTNVGILVLVEVFDCQVPEYKVQYGGTKLDVIVALYDAGGFKFGIYEASNITVKWYTVLESDRDGLGKGLE